MTKIFTTALLCISLIICGISNIFAANIATIGLDPTLMATYIAEDESQNAEIIDIVNYFIYNNIRPNMSDFEKEIEIIKYLVTNVTYDVETAATADNAGLGKYTAIFTNTGFMAYQGIELNIQCVCIIFIFSLFPSDKK